VLRSVVLFRILSLVTFAFVRRFTGLQQARSGRLRHARSALKRPGRSRGTDTLKKATPDTLSSTQLRRAWDIQARIRQHAQATSGTHSRQVQASSDTLRKLSDRLRYARVASGTLHGSSTLAQTGLRTAPLTNAQTLKRREGSGSRLRLGSEAGG
jgi:hypothetical protein